MNNILQNREVKAERSPLNIELIASLTELMLEEVANGNNDFTTTNDFGVETAYKNNPDGTQTYTYSRDGVVKGGGYNTGDDIVSPPTTGN